VSDSNIPKNRPGTASGATIRLPRGGQKNRTDPFIDLHQTGTVVSNLTIVLSSGETPVAREVLMKNNVPKGVAKATKRLADGTIKIYRYAWRGGPQLQGEPGSAEFAECYEAAVRAARTPKPVPAAKPMVDGLVEKFKRSEEFRGRAESTRREYMRFLKIIEADFGDMPIIALNDKAVRGVFKDWRDGMADRPRTADYAWSVLARLMSFAVDNGIIDRNPCERGGRLYSADRNEKIWTEEHLVRLFAVASPEITAVVTFALWTGQRQSDCLTARWTALEGTRIRVNQAKGGRPLALPLGAPLAAVIAGLPRTQASTILTTSRGSAWTSDGLRASFRKAVARAGITDDLHFHDLRGTAVTRMALAGCTALQIAAVTGHSPAHINAILSRHYLGGQAELAEQAILRLETHQASVAAVANCAANRLQTETLPPGQKPWPQRTTF
jgi:integrase